VLYTGLTRDGVFWIEDGKISHPVTNFRWNESPIRVLKNVVAMTRAQRVLGRNSAVSIAPAIQVSSFDFTSVSDAV
jgi:predicted Zn-dependent protease